MEPKNAHTMNSNQQHNLEDKDLGTNDRSDAMGAYIMMFASIAIGIPLPLLNIVAALFYCFMMRAKSPFVQFHSWQSFLSQVPTSLLNAGVIILTIIKLVQTMFNYYSIAPIFFTQNYIALLIFTLCVNLLYFVYSIIACQYAYKGKIYFFWFFGNIAYNIAYKNAKSTSSKQYKDECVANQHDTDSPLE